MKLSAEQYADLLSSFEECDTRRFDNRKAARVELKARIKIIPMIDGEPREPVHVMTCDFSARGISFIHGSEMRPGQQFITELPRKSGGTAELLCVVKRCKELGSDSFRIAAEFDCAVSSSTRTDPAQDARDVQRIRESMLG